jgi:L-iditol 2-dehydrogenase
MKCVELQAVRSLAVVERETPQMEKGSVLVRMKSVGVCGSDVHYYHSGGIGSQKAVFPQGLGHEGAGIVAESGRDSAFSVDTRVAVEPGLSCGLCEHCLSGRQNRCPEVRFLGSPGMPGAFSEYLVCKEEQLVKLPDPVSYDEGALLEPLGVAYHTICLSELKPSQTIAIHGAGPIGLLILAVAKAAGAGETFIFDRLAYRLEFARTHFQVDHAVDTTKENPTQYVLDNTAGRGVDLAVEAAGEQETLSWTIAAARIGGRAMITGIPETDTLTIDPHVMRKKELLVQNVRRSNRALEPSIELVRRGAVNIGPLASHHFGPERIAEAFETVSRYQDGVIRAIISF